VILHLRQATGFAEFHHPDIDVEIAHFASHPLLPGDSYLAFFVLWCLGLAEGVDHADALLNIDVLSDSPEQRERALERLAELGIDEVHFDDCRVHQSEYGEADRQFFEPIEERAWAMMRDAGMDDAKLRALQRMRAAHAPKSAGGQGAGPAIEDRDRMRVLVRRRETQASLAQRANDESRSALERQLEAAQAGADALRSKLAAVQDAAAGRAREMQRMLDAHAATVRERERDAAALDAALRQLQAAQDAQVAVHAQQQDAAAAELDVHRQRTRELEARWATAREQIQDLHNQNHRWWSMADTVSRELQGVYAGRSWRVTAPLRRARAMLLRTREGIALTVARLRQAAPGKRPANVTVHGGMQVAAAAASTAATPADAGASTPGSHADAPAARIPEGAREILERLRHEARRPAAD
jgi:hypothetical protein